MVPGRVVAVYVVGSTALGAYRPGRSDLDVVTVLEVVRSAHEL
jgi:predicted nucleotidyltransferase